MRKFENGDLVKVIDTRKADNKAYYIGRMEEYLGKTFIVRYLHNSDLLQHEDINWDERCFRRIRKAVNVKPPKPPKALKVKPPKPPKALKVKPLALEGDPTGLRKELTASMVGTNPGTCSYAVKYANGKTRFQKQDACHARIGPNCHDEAYEKEPIAVALHLLGHYNNARNKDSYVSYVDYMINRSPWANAHLVKDAKDAVANCASMNLERPYHEILGAAVALREASEFPNNFASFKKALEMGYCEHTAYLLTTCFTVNTNGVVGKAVITNGHKVMSPANSMEAIIKFFTKGYHFKTTDTYKNGRKVYEGINSRMILPEMGGAKRCQESVNNHRVPILDSKFGEEQKDLSDSFKAVGDALEKLFKEVK